MDIWKITYNEYDPDEEPKRESLCALGNGYFVTRGATEDSMADSIHYPGTYLAGGYDRLKTQVAGQIIENEDLVNWPNWLVLKMKIEDDDWIQIDSVDILDYEEVLNLKKGILERKIKWRDPGKRETTLVSRRIVNMRYPHQAAIHWKVTPENWSGKVVIHSAIDGTVINNGVPRYSDLNGKHLEIIDKGPFAEKSIFLKCRTVQSDIFMTQAARTGAYFNSVNYNIARENIESEEYVAQELKFNVNQKEDFEIEKIISLYTSRDHAISDPTTEAKKSVKRAPRFEEILEAHINSWKEVWGRCDTIIEGNPDHQRMLRLHIFHLFQSTSHNTIDLDAGVPPRGWHGEAYRGHILWDELFIFPFLNLSVPEITRSLLMYRYRRLDEARYAAREAGYKGAMFPWQSGSNGREESQSIHLNPQSGRWIPDNSHFQRHVNATIAYNVWQYYQITGDTEFLSYYGAEMLLEIARFWIAKSQYNEDRDRYEIHNVVGPDEYHTKYPDSKKPGLNNNAYTNIMVIWTILHALEAFNAQDRNRQTELLRKLDIKIDEFEHWDKISRKIYIPFLKDGKVISQFDGFENLRELDWDKYHNKYGEILRLDRILEAENDSVNNYKAVKQADVLMLFYLFSVEELSELVIRQGYKFNSSIIPNTIEYYQERTSHGSTLSKLVHSWVIARSNRELSWENFEKALVSDFSDIQGGTTQEGIHLGAMAGTVDLIQRCYTGLEMREDTLWFNPHLPKEIDRIKYKLQYRGHYMDLDLTKNTLKLSSIGGWPDGIKINVNGRSYTMKRNQEKSFDLKRKH